jgi:transcription initiation factor TFIID subunit TAF12
LFRLVAVYGDGSSAEKKVVARRLSRGQPGTLVWLDAGCRALCNWGRRLQQQQQQQRQQQQQQRQQQSRW